MLLLSRPHLGLEGEHVAHISTAYLQRIPFTDLRRRFIGKMDTNVSVCTASRKMEFKCLQSYAHASRRRATGLKAHSFTPWEYKEQELLCRGQSTHDRPEQTIKTGTTEPQEIIFVHTDPCTASIQSSSFQNRGSIISEQQ